MRAKHTLPVDAGWAAAHARVHHVDLRGKHRVGARREKALHERLGVRQLAAPEPHLDRMEQHLHGRRIDAPSDGEGRIGDRVRATCQRQQMRVRLAELHPRGRHLGVAGHGRAQLARRRVRAAEQIRANAARERRILRPQRSTQRDANEVAGGGRSMLPHRGLRAAHRRDRERRIDGDGLAIPIERVGGAGASKGGFTEEKGGDGVRVAVDPRGRDVGRPTTAEQLRQQLVEGAQASAPDVRARIERLAARDDGIARRLVQREHGERRIAAREQPPRHEVRAAIRPRDRPRLGRRRRGRRAGVRVHEEARSVDPPQRAGAIERVADERRDVLARRRW